MEALLWILLPGFVAIASGMLAWFVTQSRMEVKLAEQRETIAETRGALKAEREAMDAAVKHAVRAAEETSRLLSHSATSTLLSITVVIPHAMYGSI